MCVISDEYQFVLVCPAYGPVPTFFSSKFYCPWPINYKLLCVPQASYKSLTINLCKYVKKKIMHGIFDQT